MKDKEKLAGISFLFIVMFFILFLFYYYNNYDNVKIELGSIDYNNIIQITFYSQYDEFNNKSEKELIIKDKYEIKSIIKSFKNMKNDDCLNYNGSDTAYITNIIGKKANSNKQLMISLKDCNIKNEENSLLCCYLDKGAKCFESKELYSILLKLNLKKWKIHKKIILNKYKLKKERINKISEIKEVAFYSYGDKLPSFSTLTLDKPKLVIKNRKNLSEIKNNLKKIKLNIDIVKCKYKYLMKIKSKKDNWFILCRDKLKDSKVLLSPIDVKNNGKFFKIKNKEDAFYFESKGLYGVLSKFKLKKWR